MSDLLFYFFSAIAIAGALGVIVNKNPVFSAFCLIAAFTGLGALITLLNAYLVGIIQILVGGGALVLLFLFVIMRLKLAREERRKFGRGALVAGTLVALVFMVQLCHVLRDFVPGSMGLESLPADTAFSVGQVWKLFLTQYYFPVQIVVVLWVIATTGVIVLSKQKPQ